MEAVDWDRRYAEAVRLWSVEPNQFVAAELANVPPGQALDLAAGEGRNAVWLATKGWRVHAVDFSAVALDRGKQFARSQGVSIDWEQVDVRDWTPSKAPYDLVLLSYLHLPWPTMRRVIRAATQAVGPAGLFLLVGHDRENLERGVGGPRDPAVLYRARDVAAELHGFEVEKALEVEQPVETAEGPRVAIDCLVRATRRCDV